MGVSSMASLHAETHIEPTVLLVPEPYLSEAGFSAAGTAAAGSSPDLANGRERPRLVERLARLEKPAPGTAGCVAPTLSPRMLPGHDAPAQKMDPERNPEALSFEARPFEGPPLEATDADSGVDAVLASPPPAPPLPRLAMRAVAQQAVMPQPVNSPGDDAMHGEPGSAFDTQQQEFRSPAEIIDAIAAAALREPPTPVAPPVAPLHEDDDTASDLQALLAETRSAAEAAFDEPQGQTAAALAAADLDERPPIIIERAQQTGVGDRSGSVADHAGAGWPAFAAGFALAVLLGIALYLKLLPSG